MVNKNKTKASILRPLENGMKDKMNPIIIDIAKVNPIILIKVNDINSKGLNSLNNISINIKLMNTIKDKEVK